ncbi:MAG: hypothetical protein ACRCXC_03385 [Legionella sp.]
MPELGVESSISESLMKKSNSESENGEPNLNFSESINWPLIFDAPGRYLHYDYMTFDSFNDLLTRLRRIPAKYHARVFAEFRIVLTQEQVEELSQLG